MNEELAKQILGLVARGIKTLSELNYSEDQFNQMRQSPEFENMTDEEFLQAVRAVTDIKAAQAADAEAVARDRLEQ